MANSRGVYRLLLTGASGLLGSHALNFFLDNTDWEIVCPVSFRHRGVPERIVAALGDRPQRQRDRVEVIYCDLASPVNDTTVKLFGDVTHIINYASLTSIIESVADPVAHYQNNVNLMLYLLEYARKLPHLSAFVHISTNEVYEPDEFSAISEWSTMMPGSPYSAAKASQECLATAYWKTYGVPVMIINTMNVFGETQDAEKFIPQLIDRISRGEVVKIYTNDVNEPMTQVFIHARDIASAILFLFRRSTPTRHGALLDRWNVVGSVEHDGLAIAQLVAEMMDKTLRYDLTPIDQRGRYVLDNFKILSTGWTPLQPFTTSLERMIRWTLDHPLWLDREARS